MTVWQPRPDWFLQAVGSALRQQGCRIELLVVDDGSPEPVARLLSDFEDERLRILRIPHGGVSHARNAGTADASGDYVRYIDGDDVLEGESTLRLLRLVGDSEALFSYGASLMCDENLRPIWKLVCRRQGDVALDSLLARFTVRPHALLFPRSVLDATGEWDASFDSAEDWDFITRAAEHARAIGESRVATYYRRHTGSITGTLTTDIGQGERSARKVVDRYFERHPEKRGTRLERQAEARLLAISARRHVAHGEISESLKRARRAFGLNPRAVGDELVQALPFLWGRLSYHRLWRGRCGSARSG